LFGLTVVPSNQQANAFLRQYAKVRSERLKLCRLIAQQRARMWQLVDTTRNRADVKRRVTEPLKSLWRRSYRLLVKRRKELYVFSWTRNVSHRLLLSFVQIQLETEGVVRALTIATERAVWIQGEQPSFFAPTSSATEHTVQATTMLYRLQYY